MAPTVQSQYKDLLNPIKDLEKSFAVNIAELLQSFVADLITGKSTPNFNSAALLLQGSASVYGKKVEYLYNLATQLHNNLTTRKKDEQQQAKKETKEKEKKEEKLNDPFLSVDFKLGKNLSCLRKKNLSKAAAKNSTKKSKSLGIPVHLLSNDNDDKGEVFYDTRGEVIGNKGDFAINKCRLISSGWLLLPTVNPKLVPSLDAVPDYYDDSDINDPSSDGIQTDDPINTDCFDNNIQSSPDDGFGSYPPSSEEQASAPATEVQSENNNTESPVGCSIPVTPDEGIVDTPDDIEIDLPDVSEGNENVPAAGTERNVSHRAPQPVRHSVRRALKTCQLAIEDDPLAGLRIDKELFVRKKIGKKNCRRLPSKLKLAPGEEETVSPLAFYCARTYFALDETVFHKSLLSFDTEGLDQNSGFVKRVLSKLKALKEKSKKHVDPIEDEREIDIEGIECLQDAEANEDDDTLCIPFDDNDIQIDHDIILPLDDPQSQCNPLAEGENAEPIPEVPATDVELPSPDITHIAHEECENYIREVHQFIQNSDITQRVHEWERSVKPFLDELEDRESFDINLYGSRILNAFEDNNRKQTMTFRQFCRNKEKWEIHRYFMALLPLANIGNVSIESEYKEDGTEEIFVTLLSRKMHHTELEEFGHNDGSHS